MSRARGIMSDFSSGVQQDKAYLESQRKGEAQKRAYMQLFGQGLNFATKLRNSYVADKFGGSDTYLYNIGGEDGRDVPINLARGELSQPKNLLDSIRRSFFLQESDFRPTNFSNIPNLRPLGTERLKKTGPSITSKDWSDSNYLMRGTPYGDFVSKDTSSAVVPEVVRNLTESGLKGTSNATAAVTPNLLDSVEGLGVGKAASSAMAVPALASNVANLVSPRGYTFAEKDAQKKSSAMNIGTTLLTLALMV